MKKHVGLTILCLTLIQANALKAQVFWEDDFNTDSSELYEVLTFVEGRDSAVFAFDYSTIGIPEAPNSTNGGTTAVQFFVNDPFEDTTNRIGAVQIAPDLNDVLAGQDFSISYDLWMNVNGPLPAGGGGSTEAMMVGVGFNSDFAIEAGTTNGTYFTVVGEAGVTTDIRSFTNEGFNGMNEDDTPINVAGDSLEDPYFAGIAPGGIDVDSLPIQGGQDNQTGETRQGQIAFQWHEVRVDVEGNQVSFYIDDLLIAQDKDAEVDGTIFVGHADYFSSETDVPEWNFSLVDNLRVFSGIEGDFNGSGTLDAGDIDRLSEEVRNGTHSASFDLTGDGVVDQDDRTTWVNDIRRTYFGDANLDDEFNSGDFVTVFSAGEYEDETAGNSTWATGDWNGDGEFDSGDFVSAFSAGGYEIGPRLAVSVPEPTSGLLVLAGMLVVFARRKR